MDVEFDPAKDAENRKKHGLSLGRTVDFYLATAIIEADDRKDYGEERFNALGFLSGILYSFTFTMRGPIFRAISLRKANRREQKNYADFYGEI